MTSPVNFTTAAIAAASSAAARATVNSTGPAAERPPAIVAVADVTSPIAVADVVPNPRNLSDTSFTTFPTLLKSVILLIDSCVESPRISTSFCADLKESVIFDNCVSS